MSNRQVALTLAKAGVPVFPCGPDKKALVKWRAASTADPADLEKLWRANPDALPAIDLDKAGLVVLDGDRHADAPDGVAALRELLKANAFDAKQAPTIRTPGDGVHLYLRQNGTRLTNARGGLPAGVDIRAAGGYVIAPGARLPDGRAYEPLAGTPNLIDALMAGEVPQAPPWLVRIVKPETKPPPNGAAHKGSAGSREEAYARAALEGCATEIEQAGKGQRNHTLNALAFRLGTMAARGWLAEADIVRVLLSAAAACGLVAEDGQKAAQDTIRSGLAAGLRRPHDDLPDDVARPGAAGAQASDTITQDSVADLFADRHKDRLRYCHSTGTWYQWTGTRWQRDEVHAAFQFARKLGRELTERSTDRDLKEARKVAFAAGVERFAQSDERLAVTIDAWDRDPWLLGTPGGTVDLKTGRLRPSDPAEGITKSTAVALAPSADCPLWLAFLDQTFGGDAETIRFVQQWSGYSLTGDVSEHALAFGSGSGGNGKSVLVNTSSGIMGDYATTAAMDTFTASNSDRHPTDLAALRGARLVTVSETEEGRAWAEAKIKQLTGGDKISARYMRQDFFEFRPQFKLFIVGNHQPELRTVDDAIKRRVNILPFNRKPARPDRHLEQKLKAEWPAILRWMIDGCIDWQTHGLVRPASVMSATRSYFEEQDLFGRWLEEDCELDREGKHAWSAGSTALFERWSTYAKAAGEHASNTKSFASAMRRHGLRSEHKKTGTIWHAIRLKLTYQQARDGDDTGDR